MASNPGESGLDALVGLTEGRPWVVYPHRLRAKHWHSRDSSVTTYWRETDEDQDALSLSSILGLTDGRPSWSVFPHRQQLSWQCSATPTWSPDQAGGGSLTSAQAKLDGMQLAFESLVRASQKQWVEDVFVNMEKVRRELRELSDELRSKIDLKASVDDVAELRAALKRREFSAEGESHVQDDCFHEMYTTIKEINSNAGKLQAKIFQAVERKADIKQLEELKMILDRKMAVAENRKLLTDKDWVAEVTELKSSLDQKVSLEQMEKFLNDFDQLVSLEQLATFPRRLADIEDRLTQVEKGPGLATAREATSASQSTALGGNVGDTASLWLMANGGEDDDDDKEQEDEMHGQTHVSAQ